jgi:hypothetical protein
MIDFLQISRIILSSMYLLLCCIGCNTFMRLLYMPYGPVTHPVDAEMISTVL